MKANNAIVLLMAAPWLACGGQTRPKVTEVEETSTTSTDVTVVRSTLTYEGDQLSEITVTSNGEDVSTLYLFHTDDFLDTVEFEDADGLFTMAIHFQYLDGRVSRIERRTPHFFADSTVAPAENREVQLIDYGQYGVTAIDFQRSTIIDEEHETVATWSARYRYDLEGRLERMTIERPGGVVLRELSYEEDSGLLAWIIDRVGGSTTSVKYDYDGNDRLDRVTEESNNYDFTYDGDTIQEVSRGAGDLQRITRYTYGDGSIAAITPVPDIPNSEFFTMEGRATGEFDFLTFETLR